MRKEYKYTDDNVIENLTKCIKDIQLENKNKEIIIFNIGTDRHIGDSVAPLIGTMVKEHSSHIPVYGNLDNPNHALNLKDNFQEIMKIHKEAIVIGIDSCISNSIEVGSIVVSDKPIKPGSGVGKNLLNIGDYCILVIVEKADTNSFTMKNIRMSFIFKLAKIVSKSIINCFNVEEFALSKIE